MTVEEIVRRAAEIECAYSDAGVWPWDPKVYMHGEGATLCPAQCAPCKLRVDALEVLASMHGGAS